MTRYDKDTTAGALILFDNGITRFVLNGGRYFQTIYERHYRIKIFKNSAFSLSKVNIDLKEKGPAKERLLGLKASTFNLDNGKVVQSKLNNKQVITSDYENGVTKNFEFPDVREGSVIELTYSITSDFLVSLRGWTFQYRYPALWSQYEYRIPEYFTYERLSKGDLNYDIDQKKNNSEYYTFTIPAPNPSGALTLSDAPKQARNFTRTASISETVLAIRNVPAFIAEPNMDCEKNYIQSIEFELSSTKYPSEGRIDFTQTWENLNKTLGNDDHFGMLLNSNGFIKDTVAMICRSKNTETEKAEAIYEYVQDRMNWNGEYTLKSPDGLKSPYSDRLGSSSEINLLLTIMLRTAGLKSDPVLFSTRNNGFANAFSPSIAKYNSVLALVKIEGKNILLDATGKYCPFGVLPANDINGRGRVVNSLSGDWVELNSGTVYKEVKNYNLEIFPDGKIAGQIAGIYHGYAGIQYRLVFSQYKDADDYIRRIPENQKGMKVVKYTISMEENKTTPVCDTLNVEISGNAEASDDKILFNPLLFEKIEKNIYTLNERKYPIDYNFPRSEVFTFKYKIPSGYTIESIPKSATFNLADNSISFSYKVQYEGDNIKVEYTSDIKRTTFLPVEYRDIKNLYESLVKKHSEQVILKKKA